MSYYLRSSQRLPIYLRVSSRTERSRRGAMTVLMAIVLVATTVVCLLVVNIAYIEMARTDVQTAADLTAKAAANELGLTQDPKRMTDIANRVMARHQLNNGRSMQMDTIQQGILNQDRSKDRFSLTHGTLSAGSTQGAIRLVASQPAAFGSSMVPFPFPGISDIQIVREASAGRTDVDLVLCIDRSASMAWDQSNVPFLYPNGTKGLDNYFRPPDKSLSRWASLTTAVKTLNSILEDKRIPGQVHIGLVTFASDYRFGLFTSKVATTDQTLTSNPSLIVNALDRIGSKPIIGDTNISAGLKLVEACRNDGQLRSQTGVKILVVMSDGLRTEGAAPDEDAAALAENGWVIHTISFSAQADKSLMTNLAALGGGVHYHAPNGNALVQAFRDIALSLPGTLIN
jgi:Ca-activated chloride channel homolog